jgi:hypothetical protein
MLNDALAGLEHEADHPSIFIHVQRLGVGMIVVKL